MRYLAPSLALAQPLAILGAPAMVQSIAEKTGINSALGITPKSEDFVKQLTISDMFEIQSSQLAQERGNADQKAFASTMIKDHEKTPAELKSMVSASELKAALPTALDRAQTVGKY
jgi:putative membrane protein